MYVKIAKVTIDHMIVLVLGMALGVLLMRCSGAQKEVKTPIGIEVLTSGSLPDLKEIDRIWIEVCDCARARLGITPCPSPPEVRIRKVVGRSPKGTEYFWRRGDGYHVTGLYWDNIKRVEVLPSLSALGHEFGHHISYMRGLHISGATYHGKGSAEYECGDRIDRERRRNK
jgi:hypothetical protein